MYDLGLEGKQKTREVFRYRIGIQVVVLRFYPHSNEVFPDSPLCRRNICQAQCSSDILMSCGKADCGGLGVFRPNPREHFPSKDEEV